jgi:hypothetical protein
MIREDRTARVVEKRGERIAVGTSGITLSESQIARTCSDLLQADGWRMLITDPVSDKSRGKGFGELGMADRLYIRYKLAWYAATPTGEIEPLAWAEVMWIEWKRTVRGKATKATPHQKQWHAAERARGALTLIAGEDFPATIEGFCSWYEASGLKRG